MNISELVPHEWGIGQSRLRLMHANLVVAPIEPHQANKLE